MLFIADFNKDFSHTTILRERKKFNIFKLTASTLTSILAKLQLFVFIIFLFNSIILDIPLVKAAIITLVLFVLWKIFIMFIKPRLGKSNLENNKFEDLYDVFGENEQEIRYLLTPKLMEKLVDLQIKSKNQINISFVNSKIFIAIPFSKKLFEPSKKSSIKKTLKNHYQLLELVIGIVEELDLNTRIWTKK